MVKCGFYADCELNEGLFDWIIYLFIIFKNNFQLLASSLYLDRRQSEKIGDSASLIGGNILEAFN